MISNENNSIWSKIFGKTYFRLSLLATLLLVLLYFNIDEIKYLSTEYKEFSKSIITNIIPVGLLFLISTFLFNEIQEKLIKQQEEDYKNSIKDIIEYSIKRNTSTTAISDDIVMNLLSDNRFLGIIDDNSLDNIIANLIKQKLKDKDLSEGVISFINTIYGYENRIYDLRCKGSLSNLKETAFSQEIRDRYYLFTLDIRYYFILNTRNFEFLGTSNEETYKTMNQTDKYIYSFFLEERDGLHIESKTFDIPYLKINDSVVSTRMYKQEGQSALITYTLDSNFYIENLGKMCNINYRLIGLVSKRYHKLTYDIDKVTKNAVFELDCHNSDIVVVNFSDYLLSKNLPIVDYFPFYQGKRRKVQIEVNDWIFPKSGISFTWSFQTEFTFKFIELMKEINDENRHNL